MNILTTLLQIAAFLFFPILICGVLSIGIYEKIIHPRWERSVYLRILPKLMYKIAGLSALMAWAVFGIYGEELVKSATMTFLAGSATSVFAAVIFYYFTNHISDINNRKSAYESHYYELLRLTQTCAIEQKLFGWKLDKDTEDKARKFAGINRSYDGLAKAYIGFLKDKHWTQILHNFNIKRASMNRIGRSVIYFDQDVKNAFTKVESLVDSLILDFQKFDDESEPRQDITFRNNLEFFNDNKNFQLWDLKTESEKKSIDPKGNIAFAKYELNHFLRTAIILANLTLARIELKNALEKHAEPLIPNRTRLNI